MQSVDVPARQARAHYRHDLHTLTYVTLDDANGGIIRNLNHEGVAVQAVGALRPQQRVRLRFELRFPRLHVETSGQVSWASPSGQCGIRFVEVPTHVRHHIDEWIFSDLLDAIALDAARPGSMFGAAEVSTARDETARQEKARQDEDSVRKQVPEENDGLTVSAAPRPAIRLGSGSVMRPDAPLRHPLSEEDLAHPAVEPHVEPSWLSRPLSSRTLSRVVDSLVVTAGVLLFTLIFLSIAKELPPWPLALGTGFATAGFVATAYWGVFHVFGGSSLGVRLAHAASGIEEESEDAVRIR